MTVVDEYLDFSMKVNELVSANMLGLSINADTYDRKIIYNNILKEDVSVRGFDFRGVSKMKISGMITKDELETTITFNNTMSKKRIYFTIAHEIIHYLYHLDDDTLFFTDTSESLKYSETDMLPEFQANIGASILLLPDAALIYELKKGTSPKMISDKYGVSKSALLRRLIQTMQGEFDASYTAAYKTADKMINQYSKKGKSVMKILGENLENKTIQRNPFYEAIRVQ